MDRTRRQRGVTLIELIVVVTVVGILGAIAVASYRQYAQRAGRSEAKTALLQAQNNLERCFTRHNAYDPALAPNPPGPADTCAVLVAAIRAGQPTAEGRYTLREGPGMPPAVPAGGIQDTTYTLEVVPRAGGGMTDDTRCTAFSVSSAGVRGSTGSAPTAECWR